MWVDQRGTLRTKTNEKKTNLHNDNLEETLDMKNTLNTD